MAFFAVSTVAAFAFYRWGIRIDLRRFFRWTGIFILVVAAGLLAAVLRSLHEAGLWNHLQTRIYDLSEILPGSSLTGTILGGLFNYHEAPTLGEGIVYAAFLATTLVLFLKPAPAPVAASAAAAGHR